MITRRKFTAALGVVPALCAQRVEVISHRGEHLSHPENTLPAIEAAIAIGCDWVEIDVRTTRDGSFVLMHDTSVNRTTDGKGAVAELGLDQIRLLNAGSGARVPTLDEALAAMRSKCGVYFDAKSIPAAAIIDALKRHAMLGHCVVYGGFDLLKALGAAGHPELAMPEAVSGESLTKSLAELRPKTVAFDRRDFRDDIVEMARAAGKGIFVDRLGADDNDASWLDAVKRGATGIQTDHPAQLIRLLRV